MRVNFKSFIQYHKIYSVLSASKQDLFILIA